MLTSTKVSIHHGLVVVEDTALGEPPEWVDGQLVVSTGSCLLVRCMPGMDGETELSLGAAADIAADGAPVFDGMIATPSRELMISDVEGEQLLKMPVAADITRVRVWLNHPVWPDRVTVAWGEGRQ